MESRIVEGGKRRRLVGVVDIVNGDMAASVYVCMLVQHSLKVGCRVWTSTGVVILLEIRLEGRGAGSILWLVAEGSAGTEGHVVVVFGDAALSLLHAPENEGDATKKEGTADASDNTTNDLFVGVAQAAAVVARSFL